MTGYFNNWSGLTYTGGALLPIQTPLGLLLVATPFPTGAVSLQTESHSTGVALAEFFADLRDTVTITGSVNVLEQTLSGNFTLTRRVPAPDKQALTVIAASNVSLQLSGTSGSLVSVSDGSRSHQFCQRQGLLPISPSPLPNRLITSTLRERLDWRSTPQVPASLKQSPSMATPELSRSRPAPTHVSPPPTQHFPPTC
ncbi:MAG UNVERIFIED_CONTAM: hypothetical protein LVR18_51725 [Planctomycetaceae bacterium]